MTAVGTVLADQLTPDITTACKQMFPGIQIYYVKINCYQPESSAGSDAVLFLAGVLIAEEEQLYKAAEARSGGFRGWKYFTVSDIAAAADNVKTFTFRPETPSSDFSRGFEFIPGQFLSVSADLHQYDKVPTSELHDEPTAPRHYTITVSICSAPVQRTILTRRISLLLENHFCKFQPSV